MGVAHTDADRPPEFRGRAAAGWSVLGSALRCHGLPADLEGEVAQLLGGFPPAGPQEDALDLTWEGAGGDGTPGPVLADARGGRWALDPALPLASQVEYRVVSDALRAARGLYVLHAGAVAGAAGTCLLIGDSGVGKTSLTLWLWGSGLRLVTDDLCPLDAATLAPQPFPRALHFDGVYSPRLLERIPPRPAGYPADYYPFPADPRATPVPPLPSLAGLLVLERGPRPEGEVDELRQAEAAHHLLRAVIKGADFQFGRALADMARLAERIPAFRLHSGTPEGAAAQALATLERVGIVP